jgi:hypothetical protein
MILVATGLRREARLFGGPGLHAVAGAGDTARLEAELERLAPRADGMVSLGLAAALHPDARPGAWIVGHVIHAEGEKFFADVPWSQRLQARLPGAGYGSIYGSDRVVRGVLAKFQLGSERFSDAVDMQSHLVARVAARHGLPFAVARLISDGMADESPPALQAGMGPGGTVGMPAVLRSVLTDPRQLPALIRAGVRAERGLRRLARDRAMLGPRLLGPAARQVPPGA